jgi:Tol biopolymer transport system component
MMKGWTVVLLLLFAVTACGAPTDAKRITLVVDGEAREIRTGALTVRDLLEEANITLDTDDRVTPAEPTLISNVTTVRVIRVETRTETEEREVPYDRRTVHDASIPAGESQLLEPGITGIEELTYRIILEDGVEVDRHLIRQTTVREPRTEVILVGARTEQRPVPITGTLAYIANHNAWLVRNTSLNQQRLTHQGDLDGRVFSLSADGTHLLFTRMPQEAGESVPLNSLWILDTSTANAEPVRVEVDDVLWAEWEPDCEVAHFDDRCRIAYTRGMTAQGNPGWRAENDLWVARLRPSTGKLSAKRELVEPTRGGTYSWWGTDYTWSPDRQTVAYGRADEVGLIRVRDGQQKALSEFPPYRSYAPWVWTPTVSWSPEGAYVVTTLHGPAPTGEAPEDSPVFDVWAISADGTITAELSSEAGMWSMPVFAPETGMIAFGRARSPYASQTSSYDLYTMDRDGSDRRLIFPTDEEIGLKYPEIAWSPAADEIVVVYQENLYLVDVSGDGVHQVTVTGGVTAVEWQPGYVEQRDQSVPPDESEETESPHYRPRGSDTQPTPD